MKKRILALILAMGMTLGLAACGGDSSSAGSAGSGSTGDGSAAANPADFKVGAIYINKKSDTAGYTYAHNHGITTAMEELGLYENETHYSRCAVCRRTYGGRCPGTTEVGHRPDEP